MTRVCTLVLVSVVASSVVVSGFSRTSAVSPSVVVSGFSRTPVVVSGFSRTSLVVSGFSRTPVVVSGFSRTGAAQARPQKPAPKPAPKAAAKPAAPRREQAVPFKTGETLTYDVGWSSYVTAGTATITVVEKKPSYGSVAYYVAAEGRPTPLLSKLYTLYYKADTLLDVYSLLPQRGSLYSEEGNRHRMKTTTFQQSAKKARYEVQTRTLVTKDMAIPAYTQDALSALYVLRSIPLKPGDKFNMPVCDNGNVYRVQMTIGGVEQIKTGIGTIDGIRVTPLITGVKGETPSRGMAIWFSNDARRIPLRIEAQLLVGKFTLVLRQATGA